MKETKNARFRRVAEARVNKIIRMLRLLGNCSGTNTYAYDTDAVEQIFTALQIELDQARKRFSENGRIQLGAQPLPRALHRRLHFRCGGHTVLWAISAGKGNGVWKR